MIKQIPLMIAATSVAVACSAPLSHEAPAATADADSYQLVRTFAGEAYVIDYGLTLQDCALAWGARQQGKRIAGQTFTCEREV